MSYATVCSRRAGKPLSKGLPHGLGFGFDGTRPIARAMADKNYVERPWTAEEDADFQRFYESIGKTPSDPVHARLMEGGAVDFFNLDEWHDVELPRA